MARGGINKALVIEARKKLIEQGKNPSIDAVRVELGNTGSKSTIHRYLKEVEEQESARLDDEALLSKPIKELIGRLASTLKEEAQTVIDTNDEQNKRQISLMKTQIAELEKTLTSANQQISDREQQLKDITNQLSSHKTSEEALNAKFIESQQKVARLEGLLAEKQTHIESLEDKHHHSREALAHYRESVKEQRDQEQRKFDQQTQQLRVEIRALNQTISVKQADVTQLNNDNGRLVAELSAAQKTISNLSSECHNLGTSLNSQQQENQKLTSQVKHFQEQLASLEELHKGNLELSQWKTDATVSMGKLETELALKTDMINQLLGNRSQENSIHT